jgi:ferritin-like metal-binding protein YciE
MAEGPHDRIKRYLSEAHALEDGVLTALKSMADDTKDVDAELHRLFSEHAQMTERQRDRLRMRLEELGGKPSGGKGLLTRMYAMGEGVATAFRDSRDKVENHLMEAYETEHFEIATYTALKAAAETIGDEPTARLAQEIMEEERMTAERMYPHIARFSRKTMIESGALTEEEQRENVEQYADKGYTRST